VGPYHHHIMFSPNPEKIKKLKKLKKKKNLSSSKTVRNPLAFAFARTDK